MTSTSAKRRVGIYTRVSLDREGNKESPAVQERICRDRLKREDSWDLVEVYSDRNLSAFKREVYRPEYERLLKDVESGKIDLILVREISRLTRGGITGLSPVLDLLQRSGGKLVSITEDFDLTTPMGEGMLGMMASMARQESMNTSMRVAGSAKASAEKGRLHGGGYRQYGYTRSGEIVEDEARVIKEVAARIISGESLRQIAFDLNARGIRPTGKRNLTRDERELPPDEQLKIDRTTQWYSRSLGAMIHSPILAGSRVHLSKAERAAAKAEGRQPQLSIFPGTWEPILTPDEHAQVLAALSRTPAVRRAVGAHLLTGLVRCGICHEPLKTMGMRLKNGKTFPRYQCVKQPGNKNCGKVAIAKVSLENHVTEMALAFLSRAELRPLDDTEDQLAGLEAAQAEDEAAMTELVRERFVKRTIDQEAFEIARRELQQAMDERKQTLTGLHRRIDETKQSLRLGNRDDLDRWWADASILERRELLGRTFHRIDILPAERRGGNTFRTERVHPVFRFDLLMEVGERFASRPETPAMDVTG